MFTILYSFVVIHLSHYITTFDPTIEATVSCDPIRKMWTARRRHGGGSLMVERSGVKAAKTMFQPFHDLRASRAAQSVKVTLAVDDYCDIFSDNTAMALTTVVNAVGTAFDVTTPGCHYLWLSMFVRNNTERMSVFCNLHTGQVLSDLYNPQHELETEFLTFVTPLVKPMMDTIVGVGTMVVFDKYASWDRHHFGMAEDVVLNGQRNLVG